MAKKSSKSKSAPKSGLKKMASKTKATVKPKASAKSPAKPAAKKVALKKVADKKVLKSPANGAKKPTAKIAVKPMLKAKASNSDGKKTAETQLKKSAGQKSTGTNSDISGVFSPLDDRIIIEEFKAATHTPGGLIIPDTVGASEGPKHGKVLAVGRGHLDKKGHIRPLDVKLGDTVLFEPYMGSPLKFGDRECFVLRESQLLGVVNS